VRSLENATVESYTAQLFDQWSADSGPTDLGVLILLAPRERRYRIQVAPRLQPILSDRIAKFEQEAIPYVGRRQYGPAMTLMAQRVAAAIAQDADVGLKQTPPGGYLGNWSPAVQPYDAFVGSITAMAVAGLFMVVIVVTVKAVSRKRSVKTSLL